MCVKDNSFKSVESQKSNLTLKLTATTEVTQREPRVGCSLIFQLNSDCPYCDCANCDDFIIEWTEYKTGYGSG